MPNKPIIMTAEMGDADFRWADALRCRHYPPERNQVAAHITLFHHLPPAALDEILSVVKELVRQFPPPRAELTGLIHLGSGVAYQVRSDELMEMRAMMAERFHGLLTPQDQVAPRLHVTIQNKVTPSQARQLLDQLSADFKPRPLAITGLGLHHYMDGPWQVIGSWPFRGR